MTANARSFLIFSIDSAREAVREFFSPLRQLYSWISRILRLSSIVERQGHLTSTILEVQNNERQRIESLREKMVEMQGELHRLQSVLEENQRASVRALPRITSASHRKDSLLSVRSISDFEFSAPVVLIETMDTGALIEKQVDFLISGFHLGARSESTRRAKAAFEALYQASSTRKEIESFIDITSSIRRSLQVSQAVGDFAARYRIYVELMSTLEAHGESKEISKALAMAVARLTAKGGL